MSEPIVSEELILPAPIEEGRYWRDRYVIAERALQQIKELTEKPVVDIKTWTAVRILANMALGESNVRR